MAPPAPPKTMVVNPYLKKGPAGGGAAKPPRTAAAAAGAGTSKTGIGSSAAIRRPPPSGAVSKPPAAAAAAAAAAAVPSRRPQQQQQRPVGASQRPTAPNRIISSTGPRIPTSTTSAGTGTIASAGVAVPPTSLKAQLRQQIAELKRAKLLKKQAAEQQRRRQQQAAEEAARAKAQALLDQRRAREAEAAKKANKENDQKKETKKGREEGEDEPAPTQEGGRIETQVEKVEEMEVEAARVKPTGSSVPPATARQPPPSSSFAGAGSPAPEARQHQRQYYGQPPEPEPESGPAPTPTETMGPPPVPPSHRPPDYDRTHPHSQPPGPVMGAPLHSKTPSSLSFPAKEVTPSPYTYGVAAAGARYSSTPYASHHHQQQQQQQQQHMYSHTRAELAPASPNKALSFGSPPKAAGGRGGNPLAKQEKEWESPVDHGAIIENIFREMGEFESRRGGAGDDSSHGSFHMDISPIKIEGLADSPPREAEAGPTTSLSVGLDMPCLPEKARAAADPGSEAKGNSGIGKERPQEQAAAPPPPPTAAHRHLAGPWMSPHLGAATGGSAGPIPPLPPASAYFAAYTPQQFPFGFPPHAYSYPLPNAVPSPAQVPAHASPATPSSLNIKQQQQQQNVLSMASPFGAWASATATPGRVASAAQPATPSTSAARTGTPTSGMNPSKTSNTKKTGATGSSPRPSPAKKSATTILHERIMVAPSPFAASYEVVKNPIIITKDIGGSFGIDMRQETRSVLVDSQDGQNSSGSTKKRRRRVYFCAMLAVKTERQNARKDAAKQGSDILRPGDIVLSVDGCATGGLPFKNAAALFAAAKTPAKGDESRAIQCALTVARPKLVAPGSKPTVVCSGPQAQKVPLVLGNGVIVSGDFSEIELRALIDGFKSIRRYGDPLLQTNHGATLAFLKGLLTHPTIGRDLSRRDMNSIIAKLSFTKARIVLSMNAAAIKHFTEQWEKECERA